jgi:hypothetical protein
MYELKLVPFKANTFSAASEDLIWLRGKGKGNDNDNDNGKATATEEAGLSTSLEMTHFEWGQQTAGPLRG